MYSCREEKEKAETKLLEGFWMQFHQFKDYTEKASIEQKETLYYKHRQNIVKGILELYSTLDSDLKTIVDMRYWNEDGQSTWADIADELFMTVSRTKLKRDVLIRKFADAIGWA